MRVWQTSLPEPKVQVGEERAHLFLVADGMGGHQAGERASTIAATAIEHFTLNTFRWFFDADHAGAQKVRAQFQSAVRDADARVVEEAVGHPELKGMGTTVTMAFHLGTQVCLVHAGDSRAYLHRAGHLHQLTEDHTLVAELVRKGSLREDEVAAHPLRHVITNVVGGPQAGVTVEARAFDVRAGDRGVAGDFSLHPAGRVTHAAGPYVGPFNGAGHGGRCRLGRRQLAGGPATSRR